MCQSETQDLFRSFSLRLLSPRNEFLLVHITMLQRIFSLAHYDCLLARLLKLSLSFHALHAKQDNKEEDKEKLNEARKIKLSRGKTEA